MDAPLAIYTTKTSGDIPFYVCFSRMSNYVKVMELAGVGSVINRTTLSCFSSSLALNMLISR